MNYKPFDKAEEWYFSVVDVVAVLTESPNPRKYWSVLKTRLKNEGSELATNCSQLKLQASDGKYYKTDVLDTKGGGAPAHSILLAFCY